MNMKATTVSPSISLLNPHTMITSQGNVARKHLQLHMINTGPLIAK